MRMPAGNSHKRPPVAVRTSWCRRSIVARARLGRPRQVPDRAAPLRFLH